MGIFSSDHAKKLFHNKFILLIGDSVQRSVYKDLVVLLHENRFVKEAELRAKGEDSFLNDKLIARSELTNGVHYREEREFKTDNILIRFYFATRIYNDYIENVLKKYEGDEPTPDVILINSCLWDISRYGKNGWEQYQKNLETFCSRLDDIVPAETIIIWRTTLPVSRDARGGFLTDSTKSTDSLVVDVLLANYLAHAVVVRHKYDVIDMHYMFVQQQQRRAKDGIHWNQFAHRRMTNIILSHVADAWGIGVPYHPVQSSEFTQPEIDLNVTEVLRSAYPNVAAMRPIREVQDRYGGPIRSGSTGMFDFYNQFYCTNRPTRIVQTTGFHNMGGQENTAPFFDIHSIQNFTYWSNDEPARGYYGKQPSRRRGKSHYRPYEQRHRRGKQ